MQFRVGEEFNGSYDHIIEQATKIDVDQKELDEIFNVLFD